MMIEGSFSTWENCAATYQRHYELHKDHDDGVCFRSAIFSRILSYWCRRFRLKINVNVYDPVQPVFIIMLKIQYHNARWKRIVETMAITGFIVGVHLSFVNETFQSCRRNPFGRFLENQRTKNWTLIQEDEDVPKVVHKQEADLQQRDVQDSYARANQRYHQ
jgi:hypothetical protein